MRLSPSMMLLAIVAASGCGHKNSGAPDNSADKKSVVPGAANAVPEPLKPGMTSFLRELPSNTSAIVNYNPVVNPGYGISMYTPPGFEWSNGENIVAAFSNVIGMRESGAMERHSPIHVFYALPDLLGELKFATTLDAEVYDPMDYEHYLGTIKVSKLPWKELSPIMTSMGLVPVHERFEDASETYSMGGAKKFKIIIRQYALAWKSNFVVVTTVTPEPMDVRLRGNMEQAIGSIRLIPRTNGSLVLPPEGPKASHYVIKGSQNSGQSFAQPRNDPLEEMRKVNEFNRQNQQREPAQNSPPAQEAPPSNEPPIQGQGQGQGQDGNGTGAGN